ncbi:MAG: hypothetical protein PHN55_09565 [Dysgonamonadaceae bacterium]|nr:hypothetical protein [Dysgonamonadaceae bacterium]
MKIKAVIHNTLTYDLNGYRDEVIAKTKQFIQQLIFQTNIEATRDAPSFVSIGNEFKDKGLTGKVGVIGKQSVAKNQSDTANMAAYFEFGTGLSASQILAPYPQWVKDIAYEYYVNGKGTLIGKPYLFNNFLKNIETFERDLNNLLEKEFKK